METCLGSHLCGSFKLIPKAGELQILMCSWIVWVPWFAFMNMDLLPLSQMLVANLLPWVTHPCPSSLSLSSYARLWSSKAVLCVCWTHVSYTFCLANSAEIATLTPVRCQSPKLHLFPFFSHLLFVPNVFLGNEVSRHICLPAASRFCQDTNKLSSNFFEGYV